MSATIRPAGIDDSARVVQLVRAFRDELQKDWPSDADVASSVERLSSDPATEFLLAFTGEGDALGYVQLRFQYSLWTNGLVAQLEDLYVQRSFRRRGIGRGLVHAAVARAAEQSSRFIWLNTNERNLDAMRLYAAVGFSSARERWQGGRQLWLERDLRAKDDIASV